jgi:hypothetical protein
MGDSRNDPSVTSSKRRRLPRLSGKASAAWLVACFVFTAILIPMVVRLPRWVDFEVVLCIWWAVWLVVLTRLLFTGHQVTDDHSMPEPRDWLSRLQRNRASAWDGLGDGFPWIGMFIDAEACLFGVLIVVGFIILLGLIWVVIEVAIPALVFLLYLVARGMLAQAVNDRHDCRGNPGRALAWGVLWATVYTAPLGGVVWFVHYVHRIRSGG